MNLVARDQLRALEVARTELEIAIPWLGTSTSRTVFSIFSLSSASRNPLVFGSFTSNAFTTSSLPSANFDASAERNAPSSFFLGSVVIGAGLGPCTVPPCRTGEKDRSDRARPVPFCFQSFLPEPDTSFGSCRVRARPLGRAVVLHRFPQQVFVHRTENLVGQVQRTDLAPLRL